MHCYKFFICVDVDSKYLLNEFPYLGVDENRPTNERVADHVVMKLMKYPYLGKGRNVTNNYFTFLQFSKKQEENEVFCIVLYSVL